MLELIYVFLRSSPEHILRKSDTAHQVQNSKLSMFLTPLALLKAIMRQHGMDIEVRLAT